MTNLLRSGFLILLLLSGCGYNGTPTRHNDFIPLTSIEIVAAPSKIAQKTSTRLTVNGNFSGLFTRDITDQVTWLSDSTNIAEFVTTAQPIRVTGKIPGTATLTATVGSISSTFKLTVSNAAISTMTITPVAPSIAKGLTTQFAVSGLFSDSTTQDLTFDATWTSDAPAFATVSNDPANKGFARAVEVGSANISAAFDNTGVNVSDTTLLTVSGPTLQSIAVTPANPSVLSLSSTSFKAIGSYSDGTQSEITTQVAWSSDRIDLATIAAGTATTLAQGTTLITASQGAVNGSTNLKVTGGTLSSIVISEANIPPLNGNITMLEGTESRITATGTFGNGISRDITDAVVWSVSSQNLATVTPPVGKLAFLNAGAVAGTTTLTASALSGKVTSTTNLTINPALLSIAISSTSLTLTSGTSARLRVTGTFSDGSTQDLTASTDWSSDALSIATVGNSPTDLANKGRVKGIAAGTTATITATFPNVVPFTVPVTVIAPTTLTLTSPAIIVMPSGNQVKLTATADYAGVASQDVTEDTTWSIDKPNVAILVDSQNLLGQIVGIDIGTATLTATFGGKTQTAKITVQ
jgi:Bacterial Ig-like domain (group 2)